MKIWMLDENPEESVTYLSDKDLSKQIKDAAALLCSIWHCHSQHFVVLPNNITELYKHQELDLTWIHWAIQNQHNFNRIIEYSYAAILEYEYRFNETHEDDSIINNFLLASIDSDTGNETVCPINCAEIAALCISPRHKKAAETDIYTCIRAEYKIYLAAQKKATWTKRIDLTNKLDEFVYGNIT